ncbi:NTP transferase domain-containing protein [Maridesulfovibrio hydrothermalis]|uniref:UDP-N-acetylglucosamine pyrophosphorylase related protein n=1 Tax=Maridesulfovibrio hydrothermalis AM13 = DSM 14728 TaxID=1121451 RepID=L0RBM3_9BACT|nr:phosphocholine cytidylyltransferase family protein [Maridesulfovibrio hydrothermalis]CCO23585.1 UDP-N-acetylglucosamine pyrophosphorylase related protein [Maridesulfovibrio hydrothermalis AM13 = DSM 14728]
MKAIILAAGIGSRLSRPFPKALSVLPYGETILGRQVRILRELGIDGIIIVVGFKMTLIMEQFPEVFYKYNPDYYITNTSKSLLKAVEHLDEDVLWLNGDVVFDKVILSDFLHITEDNLVCVDRKSCGDEEVKYSLSDDGFISEISKEVVGAEGEAVGINLIRKDDLPAFTEALRRCEDQDYFEKGLEMIIQEGVKVRPMDISTHECIEVDFEEDWISAQQTFLSADR